MDFENVSNSLNQEQGQPVPENVKVTVVSLAGTNSTTIAAGTTVGEFKALNGLAGKKMVNEAGEVLSDSSILDSNIQVFVSTPKQNG